MFETLYLKEKMPRVNQMRVFFEGRIFTGWLRNFMWRRYQKINGQNFSGIWNMVIEKDKNRRLIIKDLFLGGDCQIFERNKASNCWNDIIFPHHFLSTFSEIWGVVCVERWMLEFCYIPWNKTKIENLSNFKANFLNQ